MATVKFCVVSRGRSVLLVCKILCSSRDVYSLWFENILSVNNNMSRNVAPSQAQLDKLVGLLESRRWLATGHARTANARNRTHREWGEIATALNSDGSGCVKTWQQWSKESEPPANDGSSGQSQSILQSSTVQHHLTVPEDQIEQYQLQWNESAIAVLGDASVRDSMMTPPPGVAQQVAVEIHLPPQPACAADEEMDSLSGRGPPIHPPPAEPVDVGITLTPTRRRQRAGAAAAARRVVHQSPVAGAGAGGRRRQGPAQSPGAGGSAARRRLLRRSPPSQRRSEMGSLTERFIAIEERRAEAELTTARAQEMCAQGQQALAASVVQLAQSWSAHALALNAMIEAITRNNL